MSGPMGPADLQGHLWAGILFSELLAKPNITVSHDSVIEHRENVSFHCDTNDVNITIHWISNNLPLVIHKRMQLSADGKTLTILSVQREDFGTYHCKVQSGVQFQNSDLIYLTVNYGPDTIEIKLQPGVPNGKVVEVMEGSTMTFSVETQSYPLPAYFCFLPNDSAQSIHHPSCKQGTQDGPDRVHITRGLAPVAVSIVEVELNASLTLNCWAESQPTPECHWTFEDSTAVYTGEQLIIEALSQEHQGTYNCTVFNPLTHLTHSASVLVRVIGPQSSLSASTLAGIAIGILVIIALATGLGCFLYFRNTRRKTTEEPIHEAVTPTSEKEHPATPGSYWSQHVYANVPESQAWNGVQKKELASTTPRSYSHSHRKPSPKLLQPALVPTPPQGDTESNYEVLVNPECSIYCHIKPTV